MIIDRISSTVRAGICAAGVFLIAPNIAGACTNSPVFDLTRALYLEEYEQARLLLPSIQDQRGAVLSDFLSEVIVWKRGFDRDDRAAQTAALDALDHNISNLSAEPNHLQAKINRANVLFHTARMNFASGRIFRAIKLANKSLPLLQAIEAQAPGHPDIALALGLFEHYVRSDESGGWWIKRYLAFKANQSTGRALLESAVRESADYGYEAARSLIRELPWEKSAICLLADLGEHLNAVKRPISLAKQAITLNLFCGRATNVRRDIAKFNVAELDPDARQWLFEAGRHADAQLADKENLSSLLVLEKEEARRAVLNFSLAKALDIEGDRKGAVFLYQKVLESTLGESYQLLAKTYLTQAYRRPKPLRLSPRQAIRFFCHDGVN